MVILSKLAHEGLMDSLLPFQAIILFFGFLFYNFGKFINVVLQVHRLVLQGLLECFCLYISERDLAHQLIMILIEEFEQLL